MNKLINACKKENIDIEIYSKKNKNLNIEIFNDMVKTYENSNNIIYHVKALYNGTFIKLSLEDISDVSRIISSIKESAYLLSDKKVSSFAKENKTFKKNRTYNINEEEIINDLKSLNELKKEYNLISNITTSYGKEDTNIKIQNKDVILKDNISTQSIYVELVINYNENITSRNYYYFKKYNFNNIKKFVIKEIKDIYKKCNYKTVESGKYNIILSNDVSSNILSYYSNMFFEESIIKKYSVIKNKYKKNVFSNNISIIEDPLDKRFVNTRYFDNEGTFTSKKTIIENGKFVKKLYNNEYAIINKTVSTGNGYGVHNLYIKEGKLSEKELLKKLNNGVIITDVQGLHAGADKITGNISLMSQGYLVENGKKTTYLKDFIMTSNLLELYNNVIEVGNDIVFNKGNVASPSLFINNISLSGGEK